MIKSCSGPVKQASLLPAEPVEHLKLSVLQAPDGFSSAAGLSYYVPDEQNLSVGAFG